MHCIMHTLYNAYIVGMGLSIHRVAVFVAVVLIIQNMVNTIVETGHYIRGVVVFNGLLCSQVYGKPVLIWTSVEALVL